MSDVEAKIGEARETLSAAYLVVLRHVEDEDAFLLLNALRHEHLATLDAMAAMREAVSEAEREIHALLRPQPEPQSVRAVPPPPPQGQFGSTKIIRLPRPRGESA